MVKFIDVDNGIVKVKGKDGSDDVMVGTVAPAPKHLRTYADKNWTNNLLALPRY